jgi:hypothetical protein
MRKHWLWNWCLYTGLVPGPRKETWQVHPLVTRERWKNLWRGLPCELLWSPTFAFQDTSQAYYLLEYTGPSLYDSNLWISHAPDFHNNESRPHTIRRLPDNGILMHYGTYLFLGPLISCKVHPKVQFVFFLFLFFCCNEPLWLAHHKCFFRVPK